MTAPLYTTPEQAEADAARLGAHLGPYWHSIGHFLAELVRDPATNSDALLSRADALRSVGKDPFFFTVEPHAAAKLLEWANTLSDLAPSRANPIEAP